MNAEDRLIQKLGIDVSVENIETRHGTLHGIVTGNGTPIVLLHGINIGWGEWAPIIKRLSKNFTVHAIDLPGAGHSVKLDISSKDFGKYLVESFEDYLDAKKFNSVHLIGHSLGAWVTLKVMISHRPEVNKAVLVSPLGFTEKTPWRHRALGSKLFAQLMAATVMSPTKKNIESFLKSPLYQKEVLLPEFIDYYYEGVTEHGSAHPFLLMNRLAGVRRVRDEFNLISMLETIKNPVMIILGENDPIIAFNNVHQKAFARIPNVIIKKIEKSGHVSFAEHPSLFNDLVENFLIPS